MPVTLHKTAVQDRLFVVTRSAFSKFVEKSDFDIRTRPMYPAYCSTEAFPSYPVRTPRVFIPGAVYYHGNGKFMFLNGRHRTATLLEHLESIPLAIQFTEEAPIPGDVLEDFTQLELTPGCVFEIPDLPVLTKAQLGAVTRTNVRTQFITLAGVCLPVFFEWQPPESIAPQLLALIEKEAASWPTSDGPLSLAGLVGIRIHEDWDAAVPIAKRDVETMGRRTLSSKNPAAVIHGRLGSELLLNRNLIEGALLGLGEWTASQMGAVLRHELAHVHDRARLNDLFGTGWHCRWRNSGEKLRLESALTLWEEYYADRKASETIPIDSPRAIEKDNQLENALTDWEALLNEGLEVSSSVGLRAYKLHAAILRVCQNLGYALGLRAVGNLRGFSKATDESFTRLGWGNQLVELNVSLANLFENKD